MNKRWWIALALVLVMAGAAFALAACGEAKEEGDVTESTEATVATDEEPAGGGTMRISLSSDPAFIDPVNLQEQLGVQVGDCLFDSLTTFDAKTGDLMPAVAESWSANDDASVRTFKLRQGTKFHDGSDVTAGSFKYAWERICNPANLSEISYHIAMIEGYDAMQDETATELTGVKVIDDYTLEVTLSTASGDFAYVVGHPALAPIPQAAVEADSEYSERPVGNGPFMMKPGTKWEHDQSISLVRFDDYYGDVAIIDGVDFPIYQDEETAYLDFQAGNLDFCDVPPAQIADAQAEYGMSDDGLEATDGKRFLWGAELATYFVTVYCPDDILSNVALRQALSLAINREAIATSIFEGTRPAADSVVPPGIPGYVAGDWPYCKYSVDDAKAKLADAGYPNGDGLPEIALTFNSGAGHEDVMQLIQSDWEAIGVSTNLDSYEWAVFLDVLDAADYQLARLGWGADYPIMSNFLYPIFHSESIDNHSFWVNEEVSSRLDAAPAISDSAERLAEYQAINAIIAEEVPVFPVVFYGHRQVTSERVQGLIYSPMTLWNLEQVTLTQ
jgi:peptide/nickel transport system substrate-binding protein/oligopeptide transport system substrate-binding protein